MVSKKLPSLGPRGDLLFPILTLLGSRTREYLPSSHFQIRSVMALTVPQLLDRLRFICEANSLGLNEATPSNWWFWADRELVLETKLQRSKMIKKAICRVRTSRSVGSDTSRANLPETDLIHAGVDGFDSPTGQTVSIVFDFRSDHSAALRVEFLSPFRCTGHFRVVLGEGLDGSEHRVLCRVR